MSGMPGRSGRRKLPDQLALLRGTRRPVEAVSPRSPGAVARGKDLSTVYAVHLETWRALCADAADMAQTAVVRTVYQSLLREIRGQADLLLRVGAALDRADATDAPRTDPRPSKWSDVLP